MPRSFTRQGQPIALRRTVQSELPVSDVFLDSPILRLGAIFRNRDRCVERLKNGLSRVDVGASFLKTVQERPSGGGEGGVEFVARMVSRDLEDDGRSLCCLLVKMSDRQAPRSGWRQWPQLPILGVNTHYVMPPEVWRVVSH